MNDRIPFSQDIKSMDSTLGHPYAQYRKCQSASSLSLAAHFPPVPALSAVKDLKLVASWHSNSSSGSDNNTPAVKAFFSFTGGLPSAKRDTSPRAMAPHGCPYVKHGSGITVILSGHKAGTSLPLYPSGSSISGVVFLSKLESVESLDVKVGDPAVFFFRRALIAKLISSWPLLHTVLCSWKDPSPYANYRRAAGATTSFSLSD